MRLINFFRNLRLGIKLSLTVALALVVLLVAIVVVTDRNVGNLTLQTGRQRAEQEAGVVQSRLEEVRQEVLADTKLLAARPGLIGAMARGDAAQIKLIAEVGAAPFDFDGLDVVDSNGTRHAIMAERGEASDTEQEDALLSLVRLGLEAAGAIAVQAEEGLELRFAAAVPMHDDAGLSVGALLASRVVDDALLEEINFSREGVHLALIVEESILAQDLPASGQAELSAVLLAEVTPERALGGQTFVAEDLVYGSKGAPYALANVPLTIRGGARATVAILVNLEELSTFQRQTTIRTAILFTGFAIGIVVVVTLFIRTSVTFPMGELQAAAERMAGGDYEQQAKVTGTDEVGRLASAFNSMMAQLRQTLQDLEQRTTDLQLRSVRLQAATEISHAISSILETEQLMWQVVELLRNRFDLYHVALLQVDETRQWAEYRAGSGQKGRLISAQGLRLEIGGASMIGRCVARAQARVAQDVSMEPVRLVHPLVPDTRSEAVLPLIARGNVIGALSLHSDQLGAFDPDTVTVLQAMADQVAVALDNARLFTTRQQAMEAAQRAYGELSRSAWSELVRAQAGWNYSYSEKSIAPVQDAWRPEMFQAVQTGKSAQGNEAGKPALAVPLKVRDHVIGVLDFQKGKDGTLWTADEMDLVETLVEQLGVALESARLYQDTQRRAAREQLAGEVTTRMRETLDLETVLKTAADEIYQALGLDEVVVRLATERPNDSVLERET